MRRFFGKKQDGYIIIENEELTHLSKVLRQKQGDKIICICDDEYEYFCKIESIDKKTCKAKIEKIEKCIGIPNKNIFLFQALPKKEYLDEIVVKAVELGVTTLQLFISDFSNSSKINEERINAQILSASKQCQRSQLMKCLPLIKFSQMPSMLQQFDLIIFANEKEPKKTIFDIPNIKNAKNIAVIVGNEGGFSEKEILTILQEKVNSITLGKRILRCTTAVVSILSLINAFTNN